MSELFTSKVSSENGSAFVNLKELKDKTQSGKDYVRGVVLGVGSDHIVVAIDGQSPTTSNSLQADHSLIEHGAF
jgi:hypothetical protein